MEFTVKFANGTAEAKVTIGGKFEKGDKNWQYFKVTERNNRKSEFAIDLNTRKVVRGKASQDFVNATLAAFEL